MLLEIAIVLVLTLFNGLLAMSELAIVSARPARLRVMADQGSRGAGTALRLAAEPGRFLSSVQIGITLVGILSGAFSGATLGVRLTAVLIEAGLSNQQLADRLSLSVATVKWHLYNLYTKLGVSSRSAALARARALNLLSR